MSRNYAQIFTAIWRDPDFIALRESTQRAYLMLVTQPGISAAGVLPLTLRRWAKLAEDSTIASLRPDLVLLHRAGMIVVDEDTEELLVRSFVRHDNGYKNPRRQPSIREAANEVESARLRRVLADELTRLGCPRWMVEMGDVADAKRDGEALEADELFPQVNSHSDSQSDSQSDPRADIDGMANRFQTARTATHNPQPANHNPQPDPPPAAPDEPEATPPLFASDEVATKPKSEEPSPRDRAFGIARWWIKLRSDRDTPVIAGGANGPLHPVQKLLEQFAAGGYTDDEIKEALKNIGIGLPQKTRLDSELAAIRTGSRNQQGGRLDGGMKPANPRILRNSHENQDRYDVKL